MASLLRYLTAADAGLTTGTSMEPVALADALVNLRVDADASDAAQIASIFIPAARQLAETKAGAAIRLASYRQTLSEFPWTRDSRNGNMSVEEYAQRAVWRPEHPHYNELVEFLQDPIFHDANSQPHVRMVFDLWKVK